MNAKQFLIEHTGLQESTIDNSFRWVVGVMEAYKLKVVADGWDAAVKFDNDEYMYHEHDISHKTPNKEQYINSLK